MDNLCVWGSDQTEKREAEAAAKSAAASNRIESTRKMAAVAYCFTCWSPLQALQQSVIKNHWFALNWRGGHSTVNEGKSAATKNISFILSAKK